MFKINVLLRLNRKEKGYKNYWLHQEPLTPEGDIGDYLPRNDDKIFQPNVAYSSYKLGANTYFLSTLSKFLIKDEYNRPDMDFCHGILIDFEPKSSNHSDVISEMFLKILEFHEINYVELNMLLKNAAINPAEIHLENIIDFITELKFDKPDIKEPDRALIRRINKTIIQKKKRVCVITSFPWSKYFGIYTLINLQADSKDIFSVAGGYHNSFQDFQFVASHGDKVNSYQSLELSEIIRLDIIDNKTEKDTAVEDTINVPTEDNTNLEDDINYPFTGVLNSLKKIYLKLPNWIILFLTSLFAFYIVFKSNLAQLVSAQPYSLNQQGWHIILFSWLFLPLLWFFIEFKYFFSDEQNMEEHFSLIHNQNFFRLVWVCGCILLLVIIFESG